MNSITGVFTGVLVACFILVIVQAHTVPGTQCKVEIRDSNGNIHVWNGLAIRD